MNCVFSYSTARDSPNIPSGWVRVAVSRLVEKHFCGPSPDCEERQVASAEEWGVLKTTAITWDGWNETAHKVLPRAYWGRHGLEVKTGDVLVTKAGPRDRVGVVVYVNSDPKHLIVSGKMIGLRLHHDQVLPQVLAGALSLRKAQDYIHARTTGMAESQVNFANDVLLNTEVCIPPLPDQTRIAAVLDTMDEAIAKTEAVIAKLKQVRTGLLHDLLTRGLDQHGQLRDPMAHPEQFQDSPLGRIPKEWTFETLGDRLKQNSGTIQTGPFGSQLHAHEYRTQGIPVIMPQDIREGDFDDSQIARISFAKADALRRHRVRVGDLIFARRGELSRCAVVGEKEVGWLCGTGCLLMRFEQMNLSPRWLSLAYRHDFGQRQIAARAVGTTMVNLNTTLLAHLFFAFPRKQEQEDVATRIGETDATTQKELANLLKLGHLKSGLMDDLLTGRVRVPEEIAVMR
jgi:type I restriction enzyme, S subunit